MNDESNRSLALQCVAGLILLLIVVIVLPLTETAT